MTIIRQSWSRTRRILHQNICTNIAKFCSRNSGLCETNSRKIQYGYFAIINWSRLFPPLDIALLSAWFSWKSIAGGLVSSKFKLPAAKTEFTGLSAGSASGHWTGARDRRDHAQHWIYGRFSHVTIFRLPKWSFPEYLSQWCLLRNAIPWLKQFITT